MLVLDRASRRGLIRVSRVHSSSSSERCRRREQLTRDSGALIGHREETGGQVEIFLVREIEAEVWEALVRPGARLKKARAQSSAKALDRRNARRTGANCVACAFIVKALSTTRSRDRFDTAAAIHQAPVRCFERDRERYQTSTQTAWRDRCADAGLHFTPEVLAEVAEIASLARVTLHVGYGTFEPFASTTWPNIQSAANTSRSPNPPRKQSTTHARGAVSSVGTTTMRALESSANEQGEVVAGPGVASLTIKPGFSFRVADALLTNFHLPRSSLLILVSAFAGHELVLRAYRHAVAERYRFYSYGDCMLIL
jgi:S-adenosylmethionine:tRNA ribosyltransferase-isomerase